MELLLTDAQRTARDAMRSFAREHVIGRADTWDREQRIPRSVIDALARARHLGSVAPVDDGGGGGDMVTFGLLNEELGRACSSLRSLLTVHSMVIQAVKRWASREARRRWLGPLASGAAIGAFALTEPEAGSDVQGIQMRADRKGAGFVLSGVKRWITFGQIADVFLVFARCDGKPTAFLVERTVPGLVVAPIEGMLGTRAAQLAELRFDGCSVAEAALVGGVGFGIGAVAMSALDLGRYSVAAGCVGIAQACLDAATEYAVSRRQFGAPLSEHQLVAQMISRMVTDVAAARLLCWHAAVAKDRAAPDAIQATLIAKYAASKAATSAALDAVQIHGAAGCHAGHPVQRFLRDAKVMEIIEGSSQIQELFIAKGHVQGVRQQ